MAIRQARLEPLGAQSGHPRFPGAIRWVTPFRLAQCVARASRPCGSDSIIRLPEMMCEASRGRLAHLAWGTAAPAVHEIPRKSVTPSRGKRGRSGAPSACPRGPATNRASATAGAGRQYWLDGFMLHFPRKPIGEQRPLTKSRHLTCVAGNYFSLRPSGRRRGNYSSELSGQSELPFGRRQTVQRAGGLPRRSSPGPDEPLTCRRRKVGAHDALLNHRKFCVFWESAVYEIRREIVLKKISTRGRPLQLQSAPDRSYRDRASTNGSRLKPLRRRFQTTKNTEHTERENTQDTVKAEDEITHGDRQDQEIATRGIRLRAATFGSWPSLLVSARVRRKDAPGSGAVRRRKLDAPYRLPVDLAPCSQCSPWFDSPVLSPWSMPTGELHLGHRSTNPSQPPQCPEEHRAENREGKGPRQAQRHQTRVDRPHHHARSAPGRPQGTGKQNPAGHRGHAAPQSPRA